MIWIAIILFFILVAIGIPIGYSFGIGAIIFFLIDNPSNTIVTVSRSFGSIDSFALMAIPLFIIAGDIMKEGDISKYLISFILKIIGRVKSSLAHVTVIASLFFGAISGSAAATVAAIGGIMIPEMVKQGYKKDHAVVIAAVSGILGVLIPPSIPLIVYGFNAEVSIAKLFLGGIIPGILMAIGFLITNVIMYRRYKKQSELEGAAFLESAVTNDEQTLGWKEVLVKAIPALIMPIIVLGGIYSGLFTPTESGAVAALYGIAVTMIIYRSVGLKKLIKISGESALMSAVILIIIALAGVFGWLITTQQVPAKIAASVTDITTNPMVILLLLNIIYLILGTFMETITAIVITTPIFLPLILAVGIDPIHFGVLQTVNLAIGMITPPMALNLLMASKIGNIPVLSTIKVLTPYFIVAVIVLIIITYIPQTVLLLPSLLS